jgi:hypothetical protein
MNSNDVTRRSLARLLAVAAVVPEAGVAQSAAPDADLDTARALLRTNAEQIAKVKLPMATEPAAHFKA